MNKLFDCPQYLKLIGSINALLDKKDTVILAIDGNSGAGKSSLAALLENMYDCNVFHMDHFFLPSCLKTPQRLNEIGGNVDYVRFKREIIDKLKSKSKFSYGIYDCKTDSIVRQVKVIPKRLNIVEGVYSMHPTLIDAYDIKVFMEIDSKEQSIRILKRNGKDLHKRFINEWIPKENQYFDKFNIKEKCDIIFSL